MMGNTYSGHVPHAFGTAAWLGAGLVGTVAFGVFATAGRLIGPIVIQRTIDGWPFLPWLPHTATVMSVVLALIGLAACVIVLYLLNLRMVRRSETTLDIIRRGLFHQLHELPASPARQATTRRTARDLEHITQFVRWSAPTLFDSAAIVVGATVVMALYSWQLTIITWFVFLLLIPVERQYRRAAIAARVSTQQRTAEARARFADLVAQSASGVSGAARQEMGAEAHRTARRQDAEEIRQTRATAAIAGTTEMVTGMAVGINVVAGIYLYGNGALTSGHLAGFTLTLVICAPAISRLIRLRQKRRHIIGCWKRISRIHSRNTWVPVG